MVPEHGILHAVGSLYNFSETAGREIVSLFRKNSISETSCHFDHGNVFTIKLSHNDDESLASVLDSIRYSVSVAKGRRSKVTRILGTNCSLTRGLSTEIRTQALQPDGEIPLIVSEDIIRTWSPSSELESNLSLSLLGKIGDLCRCQIEHVRDSADILIKADREQDIEKSISKLELLNRMTVDEISFPQIHSFCYLEGEISDGLRLVAFKDLHDNRLITTLLHNSSPVRSLRDLCVLVPVRGSDILQVNLGPVTSSQECRLWNEYVQNCDHVQGLIAAKRPKWPETPIDKWVADVTDTDSQVDGFHPESTVKIVQPVGADKLCKEPSLPTRKSITKRARTARGDLGGVRKFFTEPQNRHDGKEASLQGKVADFNDYRTTGSRPVSKEGQSHRQPPSIEPPYMPPLAMSSRPLSMTLSSTSTSKQPMPDASTWSAVALSSKSGNLVDLSVPNEECVKDEATAVMDTLQDTTRAKARDFKYTMQQGKASGQAFVGIDSTLVKSFEGAITHLLVLALPRTGRIGFVVDIGRLLIKQQGDSSDFKNTRFKTSEFSAVLPKGRPAVCEPIFTDILTARASEAESILNILLPPGNRLFQQLPASRKVTYVFSCKAKGGDQIVVESDGNGNFSVQGTEILMGTLDWHFPKRAWDARLRITSERYIATDHQRQIQGIIDNLKIGMSENGQSLELWTQMINDDLSIESITLRRETLHPVTLIPDLVLHLTEHQDLQIVVGSQHFIHSASTILKENNTLELGETATWTPSDLIKKRIVRDLFDATKELVTRIDHIGFFNRGGASFNSKTIEKPSGDIQDLSASLSRVDADYW